MDVCFRTAACLILLSACAGQVRTTSISPAGLAAGRSVNGVVVYQPALVKLTYSFTTRVDKDGKVVGTTADRTCIQTVQKEELSMIADLERPLVISNGSRFLSAAKFSVTVNNGLLVSANAEPTQKASDLITATSSLVKEVGALGFPIDPTGACNAGPVLTAIQRVALPQWPRLSRVRWLSTARADSRHFGSGGRAAATIGAASAQPHVRTTNHASTSPMPQEVSLPRPVRINRAGSWRNITSVTSALDFAPTANEFFASRSNSAVTVLAGRNNVGKSLLLRLLKAQDTERAIMLATDRFYQLHYLSLGETSDQDFLNQYTGFYGTFESPENNDKSNVQLQSLLQALNTEHFERLAQLFEDLLGYELKIRSLHEDRPLSSKYIEVGGTPLRAASTGTRLLLLILAVCTDPRTEAVYIDEPELGLAPQLQRVLSSVLLDESRRKEKFPQLTRVVLSTHSPLLIDRAVLSNNFLLTRVDDSVTVTSPKTVAELHSLRFAMLGDSLDALFLPEAIVLVEGKTDHDYLSAVIRQRYPQSRVTVVPAGNDDQIGRVLHTLTSCLGPLRENPLAARIWCVLDQKHRADLPSTLAAQGVLASNVVTWDKNGIEYLYPDAVLRELFRSEEGVSARLTIDNDVVTVGEISLRKAELSSAVVQRLTATTSYPSELTNKLLAPLDRILRSEIAA